ncbi:MAG: Na+/H+ antiporter NhaA [Pseudomonadota bacterium]
MLAQSHHNKKMLKKILNSEISTGIFLFTATILALVIANSSFYPSYLNLLATDLSLNFLNYQKSLNLHDWINDALMAIFFLLIGLDLKKEILTGELSHKNKIFLPAIAALGGIIFPALIFIFCNFDDKENLRGFAIPTATDIAFAYGVILLFGKKIPKSLKVFLVALAIFDDVAAILIIAIFYSQNLEFIYLFYAFLIIMALAFLNHKNSASIFIYLILGIFLWLMILKSGIHPTLAGVVLAMFIPLRIKAKNSLSDLEQKIKPAVNFLILPIFAFANAGVKIEKFSTEIFTQPIALGIILGLFFGKQFGVMLFSFLAIKLKLAQMPRNANWLGLYATAIFTGIGFTMSLFIGSLAFFGNDLALDQVKIGVLAGSFLSVVLGMLVVRASISTTR